MGVTNFGANFIYLVQAIKIVFGNLRVGIRETAYDLKIFYGSSQPISTNIFGMDCVNASLVPTDLNLLRNPR